jgi:hypothetical protein
MAAIRTIENARASKALAKGKTELPRIILIPQATRPRGKKGNFGKGLAKTVFAWKACRY